MNQILDLFFTFFHIFIITINLFAWVNPKLYFLHFFTTCLTAFSWFILGIFYGWGYCFLTDWHWHIKKQLGETKIPNDFISYILNRMFELNINEKIIYYSTGIVFIICFMVSIYNFNRNR